MTKMLDVNKVESLAMRKCWAISELQRRAGLSNTTLYKIIKGEHRASIRTIGKIANALGCDPVELFEGGAT